MKGDGTAMLNNVNIYVNDGIRVFGTGMLYKAAILCWVCTTVPNSVDCTSVLPDISITDEITCCDPALN